MWLELLKSKRSLPSCQPGIPKFQKFFFLKKKWKNDISLHMWINLDPSPLQNICYRMAKIHHNKSHWVELLQKVGEERGRRRARVLRGVSTMWIGILWRKWKMRDLSNGIDLWTIVVLCPTICAPATSPIQKWWQTVFMQPTRRLSIHSWGVQFFSFGEEGEQDFFPLVPNMFPWSSHGVPQVVPWAVPNSISLLSPYSLPKVQLSCIINWKGRP